MSNSVTKPVKGTFGVEVKTEDGVNIVYVNAGGKSYPIDNATAQMLFFSLKNVLCDQYSNDDKIWLSGDLWGQKGVWYEIDRRKAYTSLVELKSYFGLVL